MTDNTRLESFNRNNLPLLVDVVEHMWCPSVGNDEFKRFDVEYIVRNNLSENDYNFQLVDESAQGEILAAAFFARKGDFSIVEDWFARESLRFPEEWRTACDMSKTYLTMMDERALNLMNEDDIKLSFFASRKPGAGSIILDKTCEKLRAEGWKNLYLWTDCDCNWQWYFKHGFTLLQEDIYEPFSDEHLDYKTWIFKRKL